MIHDDELESGDGRGSMVQVVMLLQETNKLNGTSDDEPLWFRGLQKAFNANGAGTIRKIRVSGLQDKEGQQELM
jgi:hypothetical protein